MFVSVSVCVCDCVCICDTVGESRWALNNFWTGRVLSSVCVFLSEGNGTLLHAMSFISFSILDLMF